MHAILEAGRARCRRALCRTCNVKILLRLRKLLRSYVDSGRLPDCNVYEVPQPQFAFRSPVLDSSPHPSRGGAMVRARPARERQSASPKGDPAPRTPQVQTARGGGGGGGE